MTRLLLRAKEEEGAEPGPGGLPPKPACRFVALGGPNDFAFSRMQVSALAETVIGDYTYNLPEDGGAMAMPVEASIVHEDEDAEFQRDMRTAIRISGEEEVDYGDALSPPTEAAVGSALADQLMPDITLPPAEMLVDGGAIVPAGTDAPVAVLTAQDVRAQGGKPDLAPFEGAPRLKVSPSSQIGYQARTSILPIPDNISVFVIAGFPGCGADVVAKKHR
jgi:hypothetical protein